MPQNRKIDDETLIHRLTKAFKDFGYEGASLAALAEATGLKKSSLYHRFPNGKEQMAEEVLSWVRQTLVDVVFPVLNGSGSPAEKIAFYVAAMEGFYAHGEESCLLNVLCPPRDVQNGSSEAIADILQRLRDALSAVARQAGATTTEATHRAEQALVELHGSLVVARGTGDSTVFGRTMSRLPRIILGS